MKILSAMTTDEACDAMCIAAPALQAMADDENLVKEMQVVLPAGDHSRMDIYRFGISRIAVFVPIVLKEHRADLYTVLSPFNGVPADECGKQPLMKTLEQVKALLNDKDFVNFFKSAFGMGQKE